jgi:rare lipoprotein A
VRRLIIIALLFCSANCYSKPLSCKKNTYDHNYQGWVKVGGTYKTKNISYTPRIQQNYDQTGMASWYGRDFQCKKTANGEIFNKNTFSAAHKTLPLPSVVKVTNLENNKSINVIVNDRGPFAEDRIIDLSEKTAKTLGMKKVGVAKVRVEFMPNETNKLMTKISSRKKIYYNDKPKHAFSIIVEKYTNQKEALLAMQNIVKLGKANLLVSKNIYTLVLIAANQAKAKSLLKKIIHQGYKNAKISSM